MTTTTTDLERRNKALVRKVRDGMPMTEAGAQCNPPISRERVRQIVSAIDPEAITAGRVKREQEAPARSGPNVRAVTCEICGREFQTTNTRRRTCSGILPEPLVVPAGSTVIAAGQRFEVERDEPLFVDGVRAVQVVPPEGGAGQRVTVPGSVLFVQSGTCADVRRRHWATPELREDRNTRTARHVVEAERANPGRYPAANVRWAERFLRARGLLDDA